MAQGTIVFDDGGRFEGEVRSGKPHFDYRRNRAEITMQRRF